MQTRVLAAIALLLLSGCGKEKIAEKNLTAESAAPLVLSAAIAECSIPIDGIGFQAASDFPVLDRFFQGLLAKGYAPATVDRTGGLYSMVQGVSYQLKDNTMIVKYVGDNGSFGIRRFYACVLVPDSVKIRDVTIGETGKSATVIYTYGSAVHTRFADDLLAIAAPAVQPVLDRELRSSVWTSEHRAYLQRLDDTGWRVTPAG